MSIQIHKNYVIHRQSNSAMFSGRGGREVLLRVADRDSLRPSSSVVSSLLSDQWADFINVRVSGQSGHLKHSDFPGTKKGGVRTCVKFGLEQRREETKTCGVSLLHIYPKISKVKLCLPRILGDGTRIGPISAIHAWTSGGFTV